MVSAGEIEEGVLIGVGEEDDAAAVAAVAAVGAALGDVFLTAEGEAAVAAVAGLDFNDGFVDEHICFILNKNPRQRRGLLHWPDLAVSHADTAAGSGIRT